MYNEWVYWLRVRVKSTGVSENHPHQISRRKRSYRREWNINIQGKVKGNKRALMGQINIREVAESRLWEGL